MPLAARPTPSPLVPIDSRRHAVITPPHWPPQPLSTPLPPPHPTSRPLSAAPFPHLYPLPLRHAKQVCLKVYEKLDRVPGSYKEFAEELEQALKPWVGVPPPLIPVEAPAGAATTAAPALQRSPTAGSLPDGGEWADGKGKKAEPIELSPTLTQLDLSFAAQTIMANLKGPNAVLYGHAAPATNPANEVWRGAKPDEKLCVSAPRVVAALSSTRLLLTRWPRRRSH